MEVAGPIPDDRALTADEQSLVQWLLEHGSPDAVDFLSQLAAARVVSRCPCGCASIDFSIGGALVSLIVLQWLSLGVRRRRLACLADEVGHDPKNAELREERAELLQR